MTKQIVSNHWGDIFEIETDDYAGFAVDEQHAIALASCGLTPGYLKELAWRYSPTPSTFELKDFSADYIYTRFGYLPSQRKKTIIPKPLRRKGRIRL